MAFAVILFICAGTIASYYLWPHRERLNPTVVFYSDDDGQTFFRDSVYKFPPFDHEGKTAVEAMVAESNGHRFVAYLMRYTPAAQEQLKQKYNEAIRENLSVQETVLNFISSPEIGLRGMEMKLPGSGNEWVPRSQIRTLDVKAPDGSLPDRYVTP